MLVDTVIEIDTYSRIFALTCASGCPELALFDFAAAFPSVAWQYMWMCMQYAGLPCRYIHAFKIF